MHAGDPSFAERHTVLLHELPKSEPNCFQCVVFSKCEVGLKNASLWSFLWLVRVYHVIDDAEDALLESATVESVVAVTDSKAAIAVAVNIVSFGLLAAAVSNVSPKRRS